MLTGHTVRYLLGNFQELSVELLPGRSVDDRPNLRLTFATTHVIDVGLTESRTTQQYDGSWWFSANFPLKWTRWKNDTIARFFMDQAVRDFRRRGIIE
jgi:hypothetical protein